MGLWRGEWLCKIKYCGMFAESKICGIRETAIAV
jgi:hypothetical protein